MEHVTGCRGRASGDCTRPLRGCLGEESRVREGKQVVWGGTSMGKDGEC